MAAWNMGEQEGSAVDVGFTVVQAKNLADLGDFDKARETLARAIDVAPSDPELHAMMSWYAFKGRSLDPHERERLARHHLRVAFELCPDNHQAHFHQGKIFADQGNTARARAAYDAAVRARPDFPLAREALERLGGRLESMPQAVAPSRGPARRAVSTPLIAALVFALAVGAAGYWVLTAEAREFAAFGAEIGTDLPLRSVSKGGKDLYLDVGLSWTRLSAQERKEKMTVITEGAARLGLTSVYLFSNSEPVAESHDGRVCTEATCRPVEILEKQADGTLVGRRQLPATKP